MVHGTDQQPAVCKNFQCAWSLGCGEADEQHRPDHSGVMFFVNDADTGRFGYAMEYREGALLSTAKPMLMAFVASIPYPVIVRSEWSKPPYDFGDAVVIKQALWERSKAHLAGNLTRYLTMDVAMFELRRGRRGT